MTGCRKFRPMSNASRLWVASGNIWPPFCNQMVIEGSGSIDLGLLQKAVEIASDANPGARLVRKGLLRRSGWIDSGIVPRVRSIDGSEWSGYEPGNAPYLLDRLDTRKGPSCEILLLNGPVTRLVFRTHHAVMDGRGTMTWAEDIFRVLRDEKPIGSDFITVEDDLLNLTHRVEKPRPERYIAPISSAESGTKHDKGFFWRRQRIQGRYSNLLPSIIFLVSKKARSHANGKIRIGIPVDLRSRRPGLRSTSNLTNAIFINVDNDSTPAKLDNEIKKRLGEKNDGVLTWEDRVLPFIPLTLLEKFLSRESRISKKTGLYRYTAIISNLGKMPVDLFSTKSFTASSIFFIPPGNELTPFFMTLQGSGNDIDFLLTVPEGSNCDERSNDFLNDIIAALQDNKGGLYG